LKVTSGTLAYIKAGGFPDQIVSTSEGLCPFEAGVYLVPQFEPPEVSQHGCELAGL
jgi:hypothetical protein